MAAIGDSNSSRLRVLLDLSPIATPVASRTGLARVALGLAEALARRDDIEVTACAWGWVRASFDLPAALATSRGVGIAPIRSTAPERRFAEIWRRRADSRGRIPQWLVRGGQALNVIRNPVRGLSPSDFDIVHSTYARFPRHVRRWGKPLVLTLHDLTALHLPKALVPRGQAAITTRIVDGVRASDQVVCISEHTRGDFLERRNHSSGRAHVIPDGVDLAVFRPVIDHAAIAQARKKWGVPEGRYVITLSSLAPHKNLGFLLKAWACAAKPADAWLVVVGGKTRDVATLARELEIDPTLLDRVVMTGFVPDRELPALFSGAEAFAFPSLYEGFGLPVLEAMACGTPVIASNTTSLPEVVGLAGRLIDPHDPAAWSAALMEAVAAPSRSAPHGPSLIRAQPFSWDAVAARYAHLYSEAVSRGRAA